MTNICFVESAAKGTINGSINRYPLASTSLYTSSSVKNVVYFSAKISFTEHRLY